MKYFYYLQKRKDKDNKFSKNKKILKIKNVSCGESFFKKSSSIYTRMFSRRQKRKKKKEKKREKKEEVERVERE
jgi:hypothetical protein